MRKCPSFSLVRYNSWHWLKHNKDLAPHVYWLHSFLWLPYWLMPQLNQLHYASRNEPGINLPFSSPGTVALRRCEGRGEGGSTVRMRWKGSGGGRVLCLWLILRERNYTSRLKESQSSTCVDTSMSFCLHNVWVCFTTFTQCCRLRSQGQSTQSKGVKCLVQWHKGNATWPSLWGHWSRLLAMATTLTTTYNLLFTIHRPPLIHVNVPAYYTAHIKHTHSWCRLPIF